MTEPFRVLVEFGERRVFASALDWPGWSRSGRSQEEALAALVACADRYAAVARGAGLAWPADVEARDLVVVERLPGSATTDFGAPDVIAAGESEPVDPATAERLSEVVQSAWRILDEAVLGSPEVLRKGPRGGGRDRTKMVAHVLGAEAAYARKLGLTIREPAVEDRAAIAAMRAAIVEVLRGGVPVPNARRSLWPVPYAARRIAWHALDHAWEMEDRRA